MRLTLAEWKKLTDSEKKQLCDHAFKLINSKEIDTIRDGMLEIHTNVRFDPDLVKPAIPRLLDFLKEDFEDFIIEEEEEEEEEEDMTFKVFDRATGTHLKVQVPKIKTNMNDWRNPDPIWKLPAPPATLIRKDAIRTFGIIGAKKPELFSAAIPLIEKLIQNEKWYDWVVNHAINTLRILKVEEKILKKYEKIHERLKRELNARIDVKDRKYTHDL